MKYCASQNEKELLLSVVFNFLKSICSNKLVFVMLYQKVDFNYNMKGKNKQRTITFELNKKRSYKISLMAWDCLNTVLERNRVKNDMTIRDSSTSLFRDCPHTAFPSGLFKLFLISMAE